MRSARLLRPTYDFQSAWVPPPISALPLSPIACRPFSCSAPILFDATHPLHAHKELNHKVKYEQRGHRQEAKSKEVQKVTRDHRTIGAAQSLFTTHPSSPGTPFFQPDGTHIFNRLTAFLCAQYPAFGFREVLTPTMYKQSLWEQSGHWANYKDNMFTVTGNVSHRSDPTLMEISDGLMQSRKSINDATEPEEFGLKPMNCPGHCLLFQSQRRSYRDLPIRYTDFSPLHRNEISGALSGLTRVRRFHQDDGHIFCRPCQVKDETSKSLDFVHLVYQTLGFKDYALVLSTRPKKDYIGTLAEWNRAEDRLKEALDASGRVWSTNVGDGAFYGPKIDVIVEDKDRKKHQTATIQLDFQLPKRFELGYEAPAPEEEAQGEPTLNHVSRQKMGIVTPVMIHRAVLGSLERFIALLLEHYNDQLPFWLSPRQVIILTVTNNSPVTQYADRLKDTLSDMGGDKLPKSLNRPVYIIDVDNSGDSLAQKIARARENRFNLICIVGQRNLASKMEGQSPTLDLVVASQPNKQKTWNIIEKIKPGSQAPIQKDRGVGASFGGDVSAGVRLRMDQCQKLIRTLTEEYL